MKNSEEFRAAAQRLLELVDAEERGEVSTQTLLHEWKRFRREGDEYLRLLGSSVKLN